ncbi:MAG: thioredoxin [Acidiferrobacterales bacterium]
MHTVFIALRVERILYQADLTCEIKEKGLMTQQNASPKQQDGTVPAGTVVELTRTDFEQVVARHPVVFIDFWAPWCGPCRTFAPIYKAAAERHPDILFAKVNVNEQQELAVKFGIRAIPTLAVFKDQAVVFSQPGALPSAALDQVIQQIVNNEQGRDHAKHANS